MKLTERATEMAKQIKRRWEILARSSKEAEWKLSKWREAMFPKEARKERHLKRYKRMMERGRQRRAKS